MGLNWTTKRMKTKSESVVTRKTLSSKLILSSKIIFFWIFWHFKKSCDSYVETPDEPVLGQVPDFVHVLIGRHKLTNEGQVPRLVTPPRDLHFPECVNRKSFCNIDHVLFLNSCSFAKMGSLVSALVVHTLVVALVSTLRNYLHGTNVIGLLSIAPSCGCHAILFRLHDCSKIASRQLGTP